jgi:predicted ATPase
MESPLDQITLKGFKSIRSLDKFKLDPQINILIGANGAGKSNFVEFFRVLRAMLENRLQALLPLQVKLMVIFTTV